MKARLCTSSSISIFIWLPKINVFFNYLKFNSNFTDFSISVFPRKFCSAVMSLRQGHCRWMNSRTQSKPQVEWLQLYPKYAFCRVFVSPSVPHDGLRAHYPTSCDCQQFLTHPARSPAQPLPHSRCETGTRLSDDMLYLMTLRYLPPAVLAKGTAETSPPKCVNMCDRTGRGDRIFTERDQGWCTWSFHDDHKIFMIKQLLSFPLSMSLILGLNLFIGGFIAGVAFNITVKY